MQINFGSSEFTRLYHYDGNDLGFSYSKEKTTFKIWAPTAQQVFLKIYVVGSPDEAELLDMADRKEVLEMIQEEKGIWKLEIAGDIEGAYYTYTVHTESGVFELGDPYAKACGVNGRRSMVVDMNQTNPKGWEEDSRLYANSHHPVIYELHIKDFSSDVHSGIEEEYRGKYLAFTVSDSTLDQAGNFPTCINYLKKLGINYVHLLPVFDYGSIDERTADNESFNWGYDPVNYNVPEGSYAMDPYDGHCRIREFKKMVMALHKAGIGVIMDVVFNHTYNTEVPIGLSVPGYYYRTEENGGYSNGSGCGNDTASERSMFRKYMINSVCYWAEEYHIDGFRFDLMGLHDVDTMNAIRESLDELDHGRQILMYGEPWAASSSPMENKAIPAVAINIQKLNPRIAMFSDIIRDSIKGSIMKEDGTGYVNSSEELLSRFKEDLYSSIAGLCGQNNTKNIQTLAPSQVINYVSAHDDWTLWDKLVLSTGREQQFSEYDINLIQKNKLAAGIVFTCLGIPFVHAGEEFARTKLGCKNSYNKAASLNQLDWMRAEKNRNLISYYEFLTKLRKKCKVYEDSGIQTKLSFIDRQDAVIGFVMQHEDEQLSVWYNPYEYEKKTDLPNGIWQLLSDGVNSHDVNGLGSREGEITLSACSVTILIS